MEDLHMDDLGTETLRGYSGIKHVAVLFKATVYEGLHGTQHHHLLPLSLQALLLESGHQPRNTLG